MWAPRNICLSGYRETPQNPDSQIDYCRWKIIGLQIFWLLEPFPYKCWSEYWFSTVSDSCMRVWHKRGWLTVPLNLEHCNQEENRIHFLISICLWPKPSDNEQFHQVLPIWRDCGSEIKIWCRIQEIQAREAALSNIWQFQDNTFNWQVNDAQNKRRHDQSRLSHSLSVIIQLL